MRVDNPTEKLVRRTVRSLKASAPAFQPEIRHSANIAFSGAKELAVGKVMNPVDFYRNYFKILRLWNNRFKDVYRNPHLKERFAVGKKAAKAFLRMPIVHKAILVHSGFWLAVSMALQHPAVLVLCVFPMIPTLWMTGFTIGFTIPATELSKRNNPDFNPLYMDLSDLKKNESRR